MIKIGDKVIVRLPAGALARGEVIAIYKVKSQWITYRDEYQVCLEGGAIRTFDLSDLMLETMDFSLRCTCGSDKLKHPAHSYWCNKFEVTL